MKAFPLLPFAAVLALLSLPGPPSPAQSTDPRPRVVRPPAAANEARPRIVRPTPAPNPVVWKASTPGLTELTTIELRFPTPMVEIWGEGASSDAADSPGPVHITPALPGHWTWRSQESGVFVPASPPERGQSYTFSVRPGSSDLAGRPLPLPQPVLTLNASGLRLVDWHPRWFQTWGMSRQPPIILQFNDAVDASRAANQIAFTDTTGRQVPAAVRPALWADLASEEVLRGVSRQRALRLAGIESLHPSPDPALVLPGTLVVTPVEPLPAGKSWALHVRHIRTADRKYRLDETQVIKIGDIDSLSISSHLAENELGRPKAIVLRFNKELAATLSEADVVNRVTLQPEPPDLSITFRHGTLRVTGGFAHQSTYTLSLAPGLSAKDGLMMTAPYTETFAFQPIEPVVALPGFSGSQLSTGRGVFDVHAVNVQNLKVRIKAADRDSLIYALRAYRQYDHPNHGEDMPGELADVARIPFDAMPGRKILEHTYESSVPLDTLDAIAVDWRQALEGRKTGALFITAEGGAKPGWNGKARWFGAQAFVQLTDIGVAWKRSDTEIFVSLFSLATGQPMAGVTVTASDAENVTLTRMTTAADGTARFARHRTHWLLAETADDMHAVELDGPGSEGLGMWRFGVPYDWDPMRGLKRHVSLFTERPVYQPGQTVYFKAISRLIDESSLRTPEAAEAAVLKVYDAKHRLIHQRDIQFSPTGSLDGAITLPSTPLGRYSMEIEVPRLAGAVAASVSPPVDSADDSAEMDQQEAPDTDDDAHRPLTFRTAFLVEEYKPNTFQIVFDEAAFTLDNDQAAIPLQARYLLGKPLAKATITWSAQVAARPFHSEAFPAYRFLDSRDGYYSDEDGYHSVTPERTETTLTTAQARTDLSAEGRATLDFPVPSAPFAATPREISIAAEVTDLNQQTIAERWHRTIDSSAFYLGIRTLDQVVSTGKPVDITLAAARPDGQPWSEPVEARVTVEKLDFTSVRVQTAGGGSNVRTETQREIAAEASFTVPPGRHDSASYSWTPTGPGYYYITAQATDPDGRAVRSITSVQVDGGEWATWLARDGVQIDLTPDKTSYHEGDTAKILVKSPVLGRALVTIERRQVSHHFFADITSNAQTIEVPVGKDMAPNVFVSVFIVRGATASPRQHPSTDYTVGFTELRVVDALSRLTVEVATPQPAYRPGDQGSAVATVTTAAGVPVAGAEVTIWAADDGVLTLVPYSAPDVWSQFHRPQALSVLTGSSLTQLLPEDPRELEFANKGYMIGGGVDSEAQASNHLRRNFQPVAFFHGSLLTDANGRVAVPFTVPDNLTRFRLIAVVTQGANAFGTGEGHFEINKPLMLDPAMPRFANVGDHVTVKAVLLNHTDHAFEAEVRLTLDPHAESTEPLVRQITLEPQGSAAVGFPLSFKEAGTATWQWHAASKTPGITLEDAVRTTLPVGYAQPVLREMHYAMITPGIAPVNVLAQANPELLSGRGTVTVTISNSVMLEAAGALNHLLHYPYGCAEQTTSATLPWIAFQQLGSAVPGITKSPEEVRSAIQQGANLLLSMQAPNGGFGYWPGNDDTMLWVTAYAGMGLALAQQSGAAVPPDRLNHLAVHLSNALRHASEATDPEEILNRAFTCYVLALVGKGEPAYHEVLARKPHTLTEPARGLLALAILRSGGPVEQARAVLDAPLDESVESWHHSRFRSPLTAITLLARAAIDPNSQTTLAFIDRLIRERNSQGNWGCTYTNGWALLALASTMNNGSSPQPATVEIAFAGQSATLSIPAEASSRSITLPFIGGPDTRTLTLHGNAAGPVRVAVAIEARPQLIPVEPRHHGLSISRRYSRVDADGRLGPADALEIGDLVAVTLDLKIPGPVDYIAVDDALPAIFEAINPRFTSQIPEAGVRPDQAANTWWMSHHELRPDRALFFSDAAHRGGAYHIQYLARVIAEGDVIAPPAKIELMYNPEQYGLSGSQTISARSGKEAVAGGK